MSVHVDERSPLELRPNDCSLSDQEEQVWDLVSKFFTTECPATQCAHTPTRARPCRSTSTVDPPPPGI